MHQQLHRLAKLKLTARCCCCWWWCLQFEQYFQEPSEIAAVRALLDAAVLTHASSSSSSASLQPGSSSSSADDEVWVRFYAGEHAAACLDILAAWMPGAFAASFRELHQVSSSYLNFCCHGCAAAAVMVVGQLYDTCAVCWRWGCQEPALCMPDCAMLLL